MSADSLSAFLEELTDLSHKYGVGIGGTPVLYEMDDDDRYLNYVANEQSELLLG